MISKRSLDDVVCGICGICPEVCLGDGNEKNCCSNSQVFTLLIIMNMVNSKVKQQILSCSTLVFWPQSIQSILID